MYRAKVKVGILGGGQLAQMLVISAFELGLEPWIFCKESETPARSVCPNQLIYKDFNSNELERFLNIVDFCAFESEFVDTEVLLAVNKNTKAQVFPNPKLMQLLRDRLTQKQILEKYKIPTAKYVKADSSDVNLLEIFNHKFILKQRLFGYDGYGTFIVNNKNDFESAKQKTNIDFIAEEFVKFQRELAFMVFRSKKGDIEFFPLVESKQKDSRCLWVKGPVKHNKIKKIQQRIKLFLNSENYVGALGVELFDTGKDLLVNELAPRVHNSGHYSQDAMVYSQFDMHWLSLLGEKLPRPVCKAKGFAMMNLLGEGVSDFKFKNQDSSVRLHWYHKTQSVKGRKLGHINAVAGKPDQALKNVIKARKEYTV